MIDFESLPYAEWLEEANKALVDTNPDSIYFGIIKDGELVSSYYNVGQLERALILQEMMVLSLIDRSYDTIQQMFEDYLENRDETEDDEECEDT